METPVTTENTANAAAMRTCVKAPETSSSPPKGEAANAARRRRPAPGRRAQKAKRRSPAEKRRGGKDRRRSQKAKRRGQEERKEGVTVKRTASGGKRRWDKKHYCVFCRRPQVKIARHLLRKHADQQEVAAASSLPIGCKERHLLLEQLRCRGNYLHNIEVIRQGSGEIVPWRQPSEEVDARNYLPCPLCLGFFLRADLWKHQASCRKKLTSEPSRDRAASAESTASDAAGSAHHARRNAPSDPAADTPAADTPAADTPAAPPPHASDAQRPATSDSGFEPPGSAGSEQPRKRCRVQAAASRLLPISSGASESCSEILHRMNQDHVSHQVKSDWLICKYGNKLMGNQDGSQRRYDYVSQKLRKLGKFLLAAKSLDSGVRSLQDLLAPGRLSLALAAARKASGFRWSRPPLAVKTTLKTVCEIAIGESLQDGDWEAAAKTTDFYHLLGRDWDNLGLLAPDTDPDPAAVGATKLKKRCAPSRGEAKVKEPSEEHSDQGPAVSKSFPRPVDSPVQTAVTVPAAAAAAAAAAARKVHRRPWSSAEKEAVWRQLGVHVLVQSVPGKEVCQRCLDLEPVLRGRHWKDIKNQVHNQIQSQKKQQFHAQMDLQENQEQQDQIQSQKKQQQQHHHHHQAKDQPQKKSHYLSGAAVEQQDQNHIHNHNQRKHPHQAPLDQQDQDLQNPKKQLYHGHADQQDHIQVHKKHLYQLDPQNQGLQSGMDRDNPMLSDAPYGAPGAHRPPVQLLDRDPSICPYAAAHRTPGPHMDPLLARTAWPEQPLAHSYPMGRQLPRNLLPDMPPGAPPPNPHAGHIHF